MKTKSHCLGLFSYHAGRCQVTVGVLVVEGKEHCHFSFK